MKELSIEQKAKRYDEALEWMRSVYPTMTGADKEDAGHFFPELKESEDERIRGAIIDHLKDNNLTEWAAWLENQGDTNKTINRDEFAKGVLRGAAINLITWIDYNVVVGNMFLSNIECKDIENALVNGDWDKIYAYIKKKFEKQGEHKPTDKIKIGKKYKCVASPRYTEFIKGEIYKPKDKFLCSLMNFCSDCFEPIEDGKQKPTDTVEPKFKVGDIVKHKDNPHLTYILKRFTDDGDYEFHAIGKDGNEGCICFAVVKYQDDWELIEQNHIDKIEQKPTEWKQGNTGDLTNFENAMMHIGDSFFGNNAGLDPNNTAVVKEQAKLLRELSYE